MYEQLIQTYINLLLYSFVYLVVALFVSSLFLKSFVFLKTIIVFKKSLIFSLMLYIHNKLLLIVHTELKINMIFVHIFIRTLAQDFVHQPISITLTFPKCTIIKNKMNIFFCISYFIFLYTNVCNYHQPPDFFA